MKYQPLSHDVLVWGPAAEGDRSASGTRLPAGWLWTCTCRCSGVGFPTENAAEVGASDFHRTVYEVLL